MSIPRQFVASIRCLDLDPVIRIRPLELAFESGQPQTLRQAKGG